MSHKGDPFRGFPHTRISRCLLGIHIYNGLVISFVWLAVNAVVMAEECRGISVVAGVVALGGEFIQRGKYDQGEITGTVFWSREASHEIVR